MIDIKKAGLEDWQKIRNIAFDTWPVTYGTLMPMEQVHYLLEKLFSKHTIQSQMNEAGHVYLLAESEGFPVGFASYETQYQGQAYLMIHKLYVLPAYHGKGIGVHLLDALTGIALQNHQTALRLKVYYLNRKAIRFYEKYGFVKTGIEKTDPGNAFIIEDDVMLREVSAVSDNSLRNRELRFKIIKILKDLGEAHLQ